MLNRSFTNTSVIIYLLSLPVFAPVVWSHPYDDPLVFRKHLTDDGRVIYSNIEKRCFSNGKLTCMEYHPIWKGRLKTSVEEQGAGAVKIDDQNATAN